MITKPFEMAKTSFIVMNSSVLMMQGAFMPLRTAVTVWGMGEAFSNLQREKIACVCQFSLGI